MIWYGWLSLTIALAGYVATWRRLAWLIANSLSSPPDGEEIAFGVVLGALGALAWPVVVPLYLLHQRGMLMATGHALLVPPKRERRRLLAAEMEQRIRDLERQVGVR